MWSRHSREEQAITTSTPSFCRNRLLAALPATELAAPWTHFEQVPISMATCCSTPKPNSAFQNRPWSLRRQMSEHAWEVKA